MLRGIVAFICGMLICTAVNAKSITLSADNAMLINGPIDSESVTAAMLKLQELNKVETDEPIYLVMNSPGGSIYDGFDFIRYAETSRRKIHTITIFAASMAFQIVQAMDVRYMSSYSTLMSHKASGGFSGEFPGQLDSRYNHVLSHLKEQDKKVVARTKGKQTLESYAKLIQNEYWADASKAIQDGFADEEVSMSCDESLEGTNSRVINLGLFSADVTFSNCPLITQPIAITAANNLEYVKKNNIDVKLEYAKLFEVKGLKF